jgi:hypothetical protein
VAEIADLMASGRWTAGKSHRAMAEREGTTVEAVKKWANQAGRMLRLLNEHDLEERRARNAATLDSIVEQAMGYQKVIPTDDGAEVVPQPDLRTAVSAIAEQGKLLGLNAPEKHQHAHVVATYQAADKPARLAQLREALEAIHAEIAQLEAE